MKGGTLFLLAVFFGLAAAAAARAEGLVGHSVNYDVKSAKESKDIYLEGQASVTMARTCTEWNLGEVFQVAIMRGEQLAALKKITDKAERIEERLSEQESLDGTSLKYRTNLRHDARIDAATGTATLGKEPGRLHAVLSRYKQDSELPAGTLAPEAARAELIKALTENPDRKIEIRSVEMMRFHKPIRQIFSMLGPEDQSISRGKPKDLRVSDKDFMKGVVWPLRRQVPEFNEFGDEFWLLHEGGVIVRQIIQRQGISMLLEAREITTFPPPTCK